MHPIIRRTTTLATALVAAGLLAACATRAPLDSVESARASVNRAAGDPAVVQHAPLELKAATDTLARADRVWSEDNDAAEANHLAYLATQRADIASNMARARVLDADIKKAGTDAERLRLTREADQARLQAEANARSAQTAQLQAMSAEQRAAQNEARVRALEAQLRDIEAQQTERGLLVTLGDVLFAFNKAELSAQATPRLDKLANFLRQFPDRKLIIEGHTDSVGGDAYNQSLSERRAQAVQSALVQRGVAPDRIVARGYGKTYPVAENGSAEGRAMNRRVEIVIADDKGNLRGR
ncbi:OmpA family protein [Acidovorax sp. NCPPB 4044]|uniref:OmpA family protein n=1 Tax=Acidovorax sp. NCPPB 4044 TaxID=2940490 RepID=UPI002302BF14|nr:OmpA family protein [Acidovorax sp. NCPPB 4044]MDA8523572.1 OmpA family protein [Acidovorax sp. NCPPB 4044]